MDRVLCSVKECYAFRIPPSKSSGGYKAKEWPQEAIWTGPLRVVATKGQLFVYLENADPSKPIFAKCEYKSALDCEPVIDSSRYFVLRLTNAQGQHAYVGIGFNTRDEAFDFKVSLQDAENEQETSARAKEFSQSLGPDKDYSLKAGEMISVKLKNKDGKEISKKKKSKPSSSGKPFALPPPPKKGDAPRSRKKSSKKKQGPLLLSSVLLLLLLLLLLFFSYFASSFVFYVPFLFVPLTHSHSVCFLNRRRSTEPVGCFR